MKRKLQIVLLSALLVATAQAGKHKVEAKTEPPQSVVWTGSWAAAPMAMMTAITPTQPTPQPSLLDTTGGKTFRNIVHLSLGGSQLRLRISNEFGSEPLTIGAVRVAKSASVDAIQPGSSRGVTFGGMESVTVPAGAQVVSDAVELPVTAFDNLAVSIYVPEQGQVAITYHGSASSTNFIGAGDTVDAEKLDGARRATSWFLLKGVDVDAGPSAGAVVAFGDSITDGAHSTLDANHRWPDELALRMQAIPTTAKLGVLDLGIGGNRILNDRTGQSALGRLDRDVLAQSNVKYVIVLLGINDIGHTHNAQTPADKVTAGQIIWGLGQIAVRAHSRGLKVYAATLTPYVGAKYQDDDGQAMHEAVNAALRAGKSGFDGVIDFDQVTHDPAHPDVFLPAYDSGDHLHPGDAGYKAMGDAIDLKLFQ